MSEEPTIDNPEEWAQEVITHATARILEGEAIIDGVMRRASFQEIASMINATDAHYLGDFDVDFVESCISLPMAVELRRRMQLVVDGQKSLDEIVSAPDINIPGDDALILTTAIAIAKRRTERLKLDGTKYACLAVFGSAAATKRTTTLAATVNFILQADSLTTHDFVGMLPFASRVPSAAKCSTTLAE